MGSRRSGLWLESVRTPAHYATARVWAVAAAVRVHPQAPAKARVRLASDGTCIVLSDMTDIGTGTYTVLAQVAAERLGLRVDQVRVELGRSDLPTTWGAGGSWGASSSAVAVYRACEALREKLQAAARADPISPLYASGNPAALFSEGRIAAGDASESVSDLVARNHPNGLEADGESTPMWADP